MTDFPVIIIVAHSRTSSLKRLLSSLLVAKYSSSAHLIISVDKSENSNVLEIANTFNWEFGSKEIIEHTEHLGLKKHILFCGALSKKFKTVIVLEDDLLVSPYFYEYAIHASHFYKNENKIAGISLYNYRVTESQFNPFEALDDGSDVYFMQVASSWGQIWTEKQWDLFEMWLSKNPELKKTNLLPDYVYNWGVHSWKKHFLNYLVETNRFIVFPRLSITTNFDELGTNSGGKELFHSNLQTGKKEYNFSNISDSLSVYDSWFELLPLCFKRRASHLSEYDFCVDLYGTKNENNSEAAYWLTSKLGSNSIKSYSSLLFPLETNVLQSLEGSKINLFEKSELDFKRYNNVAVNVLKQKNKELFPIISIIIICEEIIIENLNKTLRSITSQDYKHYEVIVVLTLESKLPIDQYMEEFGYIKMVVAESPNFNQMLHLGFQKSGSDVLTWLNQGSVLTKNALSHVAKIFKSNSSVNWIRGIDEVFETDEELSKVRTFNYRLTPGEAFKRLQKNKLDTSTENHFFYKSCFDSLKNEKFTETIFFAHLILNFQLNVVVLNLGNKNALKNEHSFNKQSLTELKRLLLPYHYKLKFSSWILDLLIRTPIFNDGSWHWYYSSLHNFPQVIRFNKLLSQYYFTKF